MLIWDGCCVCLHLYPLVCLVLLIGEKIFYNVFHFSFCLSLAEMAVFNLGWLLCSSAFIFMGLFGFCKFWRTCLIVFLTFHCLRMGIVKKIVQANRCFHFIYR